MEVKNKQPSVIISPHALLADNRQFVYAEFLPGESLRKYFIRNKIDLPSSELAVWHNGYRVPDELWSYLIPKPLDQIIIRLRVEGGGAKKVLATVAMIAVMVAAPYAAGAMGFAQGTVGFAVASAAIAVGGSLLISALLPPPKPASQTIKDTSTKPQYQIGGGRNQARPWEPMMLVFGQHRVVPDLSSNYFTQYKKDNQFLNQIFHFGLQNDLEIGSIKIGATPLDDFNGVTTQASKANGKLTLFPGNVDTLQGFTLEHDVHNNRTTADDVTSITVELAARLYTVNDKGDLKNNTSDVRIRYRKAGTGAWTEIRQREDVQYATHYWGLFRQNNGNNDFGYTSIYGPSETLIDYDDNLASNAHTNGEQVVLEPATGNGEWGRPAVYGYWRWVEHPHVKNQPWEGIAPDPVVSTSTVPGVRLTGKKQDVTRKSISWKVSKGQYEIDIWKETEDQNTTKKVNETSVNQILCYQDDDSDYTGQNRLAVRIQATSQLNGAVDELSAIATAKAHAWDGSKWVYQRTSNPAWWFLWFLRGKKDSNGNKVYGACFTDSQIDIESIKAWGAWCDSKQLTFNYVLTEQKSVHEVLTIIARAGRASYTWQTGKVGVIWDAPNLPVTAMIGPYNIVAGSFQIDYGNEQVADEIIVNFINKDNNYQVDEVRVQVPDAPAVNNPIRLDLEGCTNHQMAGREANLLAASQNFHRRKVSWQMDIEGMIATRGDVVQMSHDLTVWSYSGRCTSVDQNKMTLDRFVPLGPDNWVSLRSPDNQIQTMQVTAEESGDVTELLFSAPVTIPLPDSPGYEHFSPLEWVWQYDPLATPGRRIKIVDVQPVDMNTVSFIGIDDNADYYASESDPYKYTPPRDGALLGGIVFSIDFYEGYYNSLTKKTDITVSWSISTRKNVDISYTVNGNSRPSLKDVQARNFTIHDLRRDDVIDITVSPVGGGTAKHETYTVEGSNVAPEPPSNLKATVSGNRLKLRWKSSPSPDVIKYEVRSSNAGWGSNDNYLFQGDVTECLIVPQLDATYYVRAISADNQYSLTSVSVPFTREPVEPVENITYKFSDRSLTEAQITLSWNNALPEFGLKEYIVSYDDIDHTIDGSVINLPANWVGFREFSIRVVDQLDAVSEPTTISVEKLLPNPVLNLRTQVIDNNVLMYWDMPPRTTLPIDHIKIRKGETWETAKTVGTKDGTFTALSELSGGQYTYWAVTVDTDDRESLPVSTTTQVSQPPDFVFNGEYASDFGDVKHNAVLEFGRLSLPVNTSITWEDHYTNNQWLTPDDQIAAGYPIYAQPTENEGYYEEIFDYGTVLGSSQITVSTQYTKIAGDPKLSTRISTSIDGVNWITNNLDTVFATDFQYIKVRITVNSNSEHGLVSIRSIKVRLDSKQKSDAGNIIAEASDVEGTIANFDKEMVDVVSITLTADGNSPKTAVYDFMDTVLTGTYTVSNNVATVTVEDHSLIAGQNVRLAFISGTAPNGIYKIESVIDSDKYTVNINTSDTGGEISTYPESLRIYLFDNNGARITGKVSWTVRGY